MCVFHSKCFISYLETGPHIWKLESVQERFLMMSLGLDALRYVALVTKGFGGYGEKAGTGY